MGVAALVVSAVAGVYGTAKSVQAQKKAGKAQAQQERLQTERSRRQAIREAQLRRASALSSAAAFGGLGGSAIAGGVGSLGSQLGETLGFSGQMSGLSQRITKLNTAASMYGAIGDLGFTGLSYFSSRQGNSSQRPPEVQY